MTLSNHIMSEVVGSYSDTEKAAIMRMPEEELSFREQNRRRRLLKRTGFRTPKTFANYDWTHARLPGGLSRKDIVTCAFAKNARNLVLYGPEGAGKTHMRVAIGTAVCEMSMPVHYFTTTELVMLLSCSEEDGSLAKLLRQLARRHTHPRRVRLRAGRPRRDEAALPGDIGGLQAPVTREHHQP